MFAPKKFFDPKICLLQKNFLPPKYFQSKKKLGPKKFIQKKFLVQKNVVPQKNFGSKKCPIIKDNKNESPKKKIKSKKNVEYKN